MDWGESQIHGPEDNKLKTKHEALHQTDHIDGLANIDDKGEYINTRTRVLHYK